MLFFHSLIIYFEMNILLKKLQVRNTNSFSITHTHSHTHTCAHTYNACLQLSILASFKLLEPVSVNEYLLTSALLVKDYFS